jgi:hypothetical protein
VLVPTENVVVEPPHLVLNTENACFEVIRNVVLSLVLSLVQSMASLGNAHLALGRFRAGQKNGFHAAGYDL